MTNQIMETKLSIAQERFLRNLASRGASTTHDICGSRAGTARSAWHRTAEALERKGAVEIRRSGNGFEARLTEAWREAAARLLQGERIAGR